jgi:hypothetical protein
VRGIQIASIIAALLATHIVAAAIYQIFDGMLNRSRHLRLLVCHDRTPGISWGHI